MANAELHYTLTAGGRADTFVMTLVGPLTLLTMGRFQNEFLATRSKVMILDLTGVPYMDSAGLGVLMQFYASAEKGHRELILAGVGSRVDALLELTKVKPLLRRFATVVEAEASLQA